MLTYDEKDDTKYWGHPIEVRTITNEFLEGLEMEILRRLEALKNSENKKFLVRSLDNLLDYFSKNLPLNKLTLDILSKVNDEEVLENMISNSLSELTTKYPGIADFLSKKEEPYYLTYVEMIKKYNPKIWSRFLTMLYNSVQDLKQKIKDKEF